MRRAWLGSLRRLLRRSRAPRPKEQEWLRLILLVRKLQRSQLAFFERFDEVRDLNGTLAAFRTDFGALQAQLAEAQGALGRLEQGLERGLDRLELPAMATRVGGPLDVRLARLDALARSLHESASAPVEVPGAAEMGATLAYMQELAGSFECLARRIDGAVPEASGRAARSHEAAGPGPTQEDRHASELGATLAYLQELVASFGVLAKRFEAAPSPDSGAAGAYSDGAERAEAEAELAAVRERLRRAELACAELEAKHAAELAEVADIAQSRSRRAEEDLKTKKRGLAELTQQNLALQEELARLKGGLAQGGTLGPPPAIPSAAPRGSVLADLMRPDEEG